MMSGGLYSGPWTFRLSLVVAACLAARVFIDRPIHAADAGADSVTAADRQAVRDRVAALERRLQVVEGSGRFAADLVADARLFAKAALWAVDFEPVIDVSRREKVEAGLRRAQERIEHLEAGRHPWTKLDGRSIRGFVSAVDGSTQPYGLVVPRGHDPAKPARLDVVLHGSMNATGIGDIDFIRGFDRGDAVGDGAPEAGFIELHPMGRLGENAYRFEGETDVDEAIESVCRRFAVDRRRIVLRGSSLGGVGTWQLGLKRPGRYAAIGPAAGPVDTHVFAGSPWKHFVPLAPLEPWQETTLHLVDAIDYVANARMVPVVAAMGDQDPYYGSHLLAEKAFAKEGLPFVGIVGRGVGHGLSPDVLGEQMRLLGERAAPGVPPRPPHVRFVTWTLKFPRCHWVEVLGLEAHYHRAEIEATLAGDGAVAILKLANITRFALHPPALDGGDAPVVIENVRIPLPRRDRGAAPLPLVFERRDGGWTCAGVLGSVALAGKRPGLQGPIDDAFATPFLCVRGTGTPANQAVGRWAEASLRRFAWEWRRHYRGDLPLKDDSAVTADDLRDRNLVLFGDAGSNRWIREVLPHLPLTWSRDSIEIGGASYPATDHGLQLITANPLPAGAGRYVVFNSGHTYHDSELRFSYMVFPRLGDWAVTRAGDNPMAVVKPSDGTPVPPPTVAETVVTSGFFDESWRQP